jgi:hypothetical protein
MDNQSRQVDSMIAFIDLSEGSKVTAGRFQDERGHPAPVAVLAEGLG